jgi:deazaflavin-dependent oxidoreductase (nitroreductase family)
VRASTRPTRCNDACGCWRERCRWRDCSHVCCTTSTVRCCDSVLGRHSLSSALTGLTGLTTIGARSSQPRTLPIHGVPDTNRLVLVASNYGQQRNPGRYDNLKANLRCTVVFRGQRYEMEALEIVRKQ